MGFRTHNKNMGKIQRSGNDRWHPDDLRMFKFLREVMNRIDIAYVATYPPQECGIATFTRDLSTAIEKYTPFSRPMVVAVTGNVDTHHFPSVVKYQIMKENHQSYLDAADMINDSDIWGVSLQHEYGIFGGRDGEYILDFVDRLRVPVITTLHTVLFDPGPNQKRIMQRLCEMSASTVVMVKTGKDMLVETYGIPASKIAVIPHGVPNVSKISTAQAKKTLGIGNVPVMSTFGLISRGKGIEYALKAMPGILRKHADTLYLVLGQTHPGVRNSEGESYRKELLQIVADLGIEKNVRFNNKYLGMDELLNYLSATDVYVTPYINRDQIVSGALAYALGCGRAIVSTKYLYAEEVLSNGSGLLVDFKNPEEIAASVIAILDDPVMRARMEELSYAYGRASKWFNVAIEYLDLFHTKCPRPEARHPRVRFNKTIEAQRRRTG